MVGFIRRMIIRKWKQVATNLINAVSGDRWVIETDGLLLKNVTGYVVRHDLFFVQISQYPMQSRISNALYNCNVLVLIIGLKKWHSFLNLLVTIPSLKSLKSCIDCITHSTNILQLICQVKLEAEQFQFARNFSFDNCQHTSTFLRKVKQSMFE